MIRWCNGDKVQVETSASFGGLILTLHKVASNSGNVQLIDKTGTIYHTHKNNIKTIIPEDLNPDHWRDMITMDPEDMYLFIKPTKPEKEKIIYRPKKDQYKRKREEAYRRSKK